MFSCSYQMAILVNTFYARTNMSARTSTGMHRCLRIADIQALICRSLTRNGCIQLAQTCTTLYEEAMNVVWADMHTLIPLIGCMSRDALALVTRARGAPRSREYFLHIVSQLFLQHNVHFYDLCMVFPRDRISAGSLRLPIGVHSANTLTESALLKTDACASSTLSLGSHSEAKQIHSQMHRSSSRQTHCKASPNLSSNTAPPTPRAYSQDLPV